MTEIVVTFICDFIRNSRHERKDKSENLDKSNNKETKISLESKNNEKVKMVNEEEPLTSIVNTEKPVRFLHIEYNLFPGKIVNKIDVVFWGTVAKVYTKDGTKAMKSVNNGDHCWVAFSIQHKVVLTEKDLEILKRHKMNLSITTNKNKFIFGAAKKDAEKTFYFPTEAIEKKYIFAEAFETDPNLEKTTKIDFKTQNKIDVQLILNDLLDFPTKIESISNLQIPSDLHQKIVLNMTERVFNNKLVECCNDLDEPLDVEELIAIKKGNKKGAKKKVKPGKVDKYDFSEIIIPGELFLTDPMSTLNLNLKNNDIDNSFAFIEVRHLFNTEQKKKLNPLIIKIKKIMNIPSDVLQNHRFSYMYITYNICNIDHITGARAIAKNIHFSDNHVYFVPKDQLEKLAQVIQNDFLIFQVHGIRITAPEKRHEMFGENINDKSISTPINKSNEVRKYIEGSTELNKNSVLLAVARIRLSDLLLPYWQIKTEQRVVHPRVLRHLDKEEHFNKLTINEMMIESLKIFDQNPLTEKLLLSSGMSIHVAVQILNPLKNILFDLIEAKKFYNRLTIQVLNIGLAKSIVFNLFVHNSHWLQRENVAPKFIKRKRPILDIYEKNLITGFAVDCVDHCILFLEGHKKWILHLFWKLMRKEKKVNIKLMYNSDHLHYSRIYGALIPYGGIYFICMHVSPYQLLICASTYVKGDMPECCRRVFINLSRYSSLNQFFIRK